MQEGKPAEVGSSGQAGPATPGSSLSDLLPNIYAELRRLAAGYLRCERPDHTLQPTALVHEAFLRLSDRKSPGFPTRDDFFAAAAQAIRRVLVDHARARNCVKRGGSEKRRVHLDATQLMAPNGQLDLLDLDDALCRLAEVDPERAQVVELRFFGGMTEEEAALALRISRRTVQTHWRGARAWLQRELER